MSVMMVPHQRIGRASHGNYFVNRPVFFFMVCQSFYGHSVWSDSVVPISDTFEVLIKKYQKLRNRASHFHNITTLCANP